MNLKRRASAGMAAMLAGLVRFGVNTRRTLDGSGQQTYLRMDNSLSD